MYQDDEEEEVEEKKISGGVRLTSHIFFYRTMIPFYGIQYNHAVAIHPW